MARTRREREEEKRRSEYQLRLLNLSRAGMLAFVVAVIGASLGEVTLSLTGAVVALAAVVVGVVLRRRYRSRL
jgi:hypothetical protein